MYTINNKSQLHIFFSVSAAQRCIQWRLFPLAGHAKVRLLDFNVGRTRLTELVSLISVFQVSPHACEICRNLKVAVLFGSNLEEKKK